MSNRVEELELKVSELQAAVNGLTEELVETKERLRQLEDAAEVDVPTSAPEPSPTESADVDADAEVDDEEAKSPDADEEENESESAADDSDIIVA